MYAEDTDVIYKNTDRGWLLFARANRSKRRFTKLKMMVSSPSRSSIPVRVIDGNMYIIVLTEASERMIGTLPGNKAQEDTDLGVQLVI